MSEVGSLDGGEDVPYSHQSDGTGSIGGNLIGDLEDEGESNLRTGLLGFLQLVAVLALTRTPG